MNKQDTLKSNSTTFPGKYNLLVGPNLISSLVTPASSLLQLVQTPGSPELLQLSDGAIQAAINKKANQSDMNISGISGLTDVLAGLTPFSFLNSYVKNTDAYSRSYIDSNYYTRGNCDAKFATLDFVGGNFSQKFVVTHTPAQSTFYHFVSITIPTTKLSDGHTLRMDLSMVKDKKALYGETLPVSYTHLTLPTKRIV